MDLAYSKRTLDNGLDVIVHEDHGLPIIALNVWYHVGSKNERLGHTGFAHLFEHLMFEGSEHHDRGYFRPLQEAGASVNGSTNTDRTNYWEVVPANALELALWMESDRMGYLLPALTPEKFENQREVVLNERRQNYENRPYGRATMAIVAELYSPQHPYHWATIGAGEDIRAATIEEAQDFFRAYYHPGNASLVVAGDVSTSRGFDLAEDYFGTIERGPSVPPVSVPFEGGMPEGERRIVLGDRVELARLYLAWRSPALFADGDAEMDLLTDVLANGKTSRLYRSLVYERKIATDVAAVQQSRELSGFVQIVATAAPPHSLDELDAAISEHVDRLTSEGPADEELERTRVQIEAQFTYRLQHVGGFGGKSDQLNAYNVFLGDPGSFGRDLARYLAATRESIRATAAEWLRRDRRVALSIVPRTQMNLAVAGSEPVVIA
ncbi:MAG: insulinase family protein [Acidobacteria bacterium]|nr:insulinase family protein [Acidobacteriota bacterium]